MRPIRLVIRRGTGLVYLAAWMWNLHSLIRYAALHLAADANLALEVGTSFGPGLMILRVLILATSALAGARLARAGIPDALLLPALRTLLYCGFAALLVATLAVPAIVPAYPRWPTQSIFLASLGAAQIAWAIAWERASRRALGQPPGPPPLGWARKRLDLAIGNILGLLVLLEILLSVWGALHPSPLVFHESVAASLEAHRQPAHQPFHDGRLNSGGFADDDFDGNAGSDDLVIAVIGDSFGLGVVPIPDNYVSVAEDALRKGRPAQSPAVFLDNYGVPAIGLPEYAELFRSEVRRTRPSLVVVSVFVGNDIHEGLSFTRPKQHRYRFQEWLICSVARRSATLLGTGREDLRRVGKLGRATELTKALPEIAPPLATAEEPTFSKERFLEIERNRMIVTEADRPETIAGYEQFFAGLRYFDDALGDSLVIVIIPDEFQVNDKLWRSIGGDERPLERDLPQRRILDFCQRRAIECIDLLPVLRAAEARQSTYHLRDTHWNRFGNRVAGLELARRLREILERHPGRGLDDGEDPGPWPRSVTRSRRESPDAHETE